MARSSGFARIKLTLFIVTILVTLAVSSGSLPTPPGTSGPTGGPIASLTANINVFETPVPRHTPNWAYDGCGYGVGASAALVRQWLTYAESGCSRWGDEYSKAVADCHSGASTYCNAIAYVDTNLVYRANTPGDLLSIAPESWYLHAPSPHQTTPITTTYDGGGYLMNQGNAAYRAWWQKYVNASFPGADGLFMDDQPPYLPLYNLTSLHSHEPEAALSQSVYQATHLAMSDSLIHDAPFPVPYPQIDNTIPDCGNPYEHAQGVGPTGNMITGPVEGLLAEACPIDQGVLTDYYANFLDDVAWIENNTGGVVVFLSYGAAGATTETQDRLIQEATELLGYKNSQMVSWPDLEEGNEALSVFPESGIYPTDPLQTMGRPSGSSCLERAGSCSSGGHHDLQVSIGVYRREFSSCYDQAAAIGACAAIVNTTSRPVTVMPNWLSERYSHSITLVCNGAPCSSSNTADSDVQQGGTIELAGPAFVTGATKVPARSALLLSN